MKLVVAALVFLGALGVFIWMGIVEGSVPVLGIQSLKSEGFTGECRIDDGVVHSIERMASPLVFTIRSEKDPRLLLAVESNRIPPDNFSQGKKVSVKGSYDPPTQKFIADQVTTACPSKYEASKEGQKAGPAAAPSTAPLPGKKR